MFSARMIAKTSVIGCLTERAIERVSRSRSSERSACPRHHSGRIDSARAIMPGSSPKFAEQYTCWAGSCSSTAFSKCSLD